MKLREMYPYWAGTHEEMLDLLALLTPEQWNTRFNIRDGASIRSVVLGLIEREGFWIVYVAQERAFDPLDYGSLKAGADIIDQYRATRAVTERYVAALQPDALRSVRVAPADPVLNEIERNVPLGWVIWRVLEQELIGLGEVRLMRALLQNR